MFYIPLMKSEPEISRCIWVTKEIVAAEIQSLGRIRKFVYSFTVEDIQRCVDSYLRHQIAGGTFTTEVQFVSRIHLLHPHDFQEHCSIYGFTQPQVSDLIENPDAAHEIIAQWEIPERLMEVREYLIRACQRHLDFLQKSAMFDFYDAKKIEGLIREYVKFLDLKKSHPTQLVVPTLDQDLIWHTHQLDNAKYETEVRELSGIFLNHDDDLPEEVLKSNFAMTKTLWQAKYGAWKPRSIICFIGFLFATVGFVAFLFGTFGAPPETIVNFNVASDTTANADTTDMPIKTTETSETYRYIGDGYCRSRCDGSVQWCSKDHHWQDYCFDSIVTCQNKCERNRNCYGFGFSYTPSRDSMEHGSEFCDSGRCVIYTPKNNNDKWAISRTTSDRSEYDCYCKLENGGCTGGSSGKAFPSWLIVFIVFLVIGFCCLLYCIQKYKVDYSYMYKNRQTMEARNRTVNPPPTKTTNIMMNPPA